MAETVNTSLRIPADLYERLRRAAQADRRSVTSLLLLYAEIGLQDDETGRPRPRLKEHDGS
jgi:hypothetical protein